MKAEKDIKNGKGFAGTDVSSLDELIVPDVEIEGYRFWLLTAGKNYFQYVYIPTSAKIDNNMQVDFDNHIVIYIARPEYVPNKEDPLQGLVGQEGGFIAVIVAIIFGISYYKEHNKVIYTSAICGILLSPMSRPGLPCAIRQRSHTMKPSNTVS